MNGQRLLASTESNFNFALTFYNKQTMALVNATNFVEVEVNQMTWGVGDDNSSVAIQDDQMQLRPCKADDFDGKRLYEAQDNLLDFF